jgi:hypothetical protein
VTERTRRWLAYASAGLTLGCLVDLDAPCGEGFVPNGSGGCTCLPDSVVVAGQCTPCDAHSHPSGQSCVCDRGFEQVGGRGACVAEADPPAQSLDASTPGADSAPPLSNTCSASIECSAGQLCDVHGSKTCVASPDGLGISCKASADCAATEATYCDTFSTHTCQLQGCKDQAGVCAGDLTCCDYAILGTSLCVPPESLQAGECPAPGQLIPREDAQ